jgi:hypothetical protein
LSAGGESFVTVGDELLNGPLACTPKLYHCGKDAGEFHFTVTRTPSHAQILNSQLDEPSRGIYL